MHLTQRTRVITIALVILALGAVGYYRLQTPLVAHEAARITPQSDYRYYTGIIGGRRHVHLIYWSSDLPSQSVQHYLFDGELVYDGVSTAPLTVSIDFTSGGTFTMGVEEGASFSTYTNKNSIMDCSAGGLACGKWTDVSGITSDAGFTAVAPFPIGDFLKK